MTERISRCTGLFADDAKLLRKIRNYKNCDINKIYECTKTWEIKFNAKKYHVLEMGKSVTRPSYKLGQNIMSIEKEEKDLEVVIQNNLSPEKYIDIIFCDPLPRKNVEIRKKITTKMAPELKDLTYKKRLKEMQLNTLEERRQRGGLIMIYELMNNLEVTDIKDIILRRKLDAGRETRKNCKNEFA